MSERGWSCPLCGEGYPHRPSYVTPRGEHAAAAALIATADLEAQGPYVVPGDGPLELERTSLVFPAVVVYLLGFVFGLGAGVLSRSLIGAIV